MIPCTRLYAYIGCQLRAAAMAAPPSGQGAHMAPGSKNILQMLFWDCQHQRKRCLTSWVPRCHMVRLFHLSLLHGIMLCFCCDMACNLLHAVYHSKDVDTWLLCLTFGRRWVHLPLDQQLLTALSGQTVRRVFCFEADSETTCMTRSSFVSFVRTATLTSKRCVERPFKSASLIAEGGLHVHCASGP